jgi:hypothetical protein
MSLAKGNFTQNIFLNILKFEKTCVSEKPLQGLNHSKSLPSKGSQEHLRAQSPKNTQGLRTNYELQRACFFCAKSGSSFLLRKAKPGDKCIRSRVEERALGYGRSLRRR